MLLDLRIKKVEMGLNRVHHLLGPRAAPCWCTHFAMFKAGNAGLSPSFAAVEPFMASYPDVAYYQQSHLIGNCQPSPSHNSKSLTKKPMEHCKSKLEFDLP